MKTQIRFLIVLGALISASGITIPAGSSSYSPSTSPNQVFVVNTQDASVSLVDLKDMKETLRFSVGPRPYGVAVSRDGKTVAVGVEDEERVKFYNTNDFKLKGETRIGPMFNDHLMPSLDGSISC